MNVDLRFPNINASTPEGQMAQMQSYMHQLVQQLNWALNSLDEAAAGNASSVVMSKPKEALTPEEAVNTFNSIKSLIIKSADIVKAYEKTIKTDFSGEYLAVSEFGEYSEKTSAAIEENSKGLTAVYTNVQTIGEDVKATNAYIKRGLLGNDDNGNAVYGVAVGQTNEKGEYNRYAWFTANKLSFFDGGGNEVAYISSEKLYIRNAVFTGTLQFGGYKVDTSDGLAFTWIGG